MPAAKTHRGRLRQVERWLRAEFPPRLPVKVSVADFGALGDDPKEDEETWGSCDLVKDRFEIVICADLLAKETSAFAIMLLFHEWAHALSWDAPIKQDHPDEWGLWYGRIYRAYNDDGGYERGLKLSPNPWR